VVAIEMTNTYTAGTARNVVADLPGTESDGELVLAGAHLDSWDVADGATDNGLGCAIVLEMARALALLDERPRRAMRFALWAAEEVGLLGSKRYVEKRSGSLAKHVAVMNFDMTGAPIGYWTPGHPAPHARLTRLAAQLAPLGMTTPIAHRARLHSDHQPFMLAGVPIVCIESELRDEGRHYYHSTGDTFEKVSLRDLCLAATAGAATLWTLAQTEEPLWPHLTPTEVRRMLEEARLIEPLRAEGYDGPPMRLAQ
jgi:Zn-dependent M28 family amino/carboxypeptidase